MHVCLDIVVSFWGREPGNIHGKKAALAKAQSSVWGQSSSIVQAYEGFLVPGREDGGAT